MDDLELIILGSASGMPEPDRAHASLALRRDGHLWLLDAGEGVCSSLLRWELDPQDICGIYITHCHPDHCVGIFMTLQYLHMAGFQERIDIYLPGGAIDAFQTFMDQLYLVRGEVNPKYELRPLEAGHQLDDNITLETYRTKHLQRWEELGLPGIETGSYAFRVVTSERSTFYSGDIDAFDDIAETLHQGELLVLEAAHTDIKAVLERLAELDIKDLVLTHALPDQGDQRSKFETLAQKHGIELVFARDGLRIPL